MSKTNLFWTFAVFGLKYGCMRTLKKAVVDIDNTLWHFCGPLYEGLKKINPAFPPPEFWIDWNFWMHYCSEDEFMGVIHAIHLNQDDDMNLPYSEASGFLLRLKENGFHIVIASHRTTESFARTRRWLLKHDLVFDDIHLSFDKTVLFDEACHMVIDDSPFVLEKAAERNIIASGLSFPWNKDARNNGYRLFDSLGEILRHVLKSSKGE